MRKDAREIVFKLIFEFLFLKEPDEETKTELLLENKAVVSDHDAEYVHSVYEGVIANFDTLYEAVNERANIFKGERIFKTDLAVMLLAAYELKFCEDIPPVVSINEALILAGKYCSENSIPFINGILAKIKLDAEQKGK